MRYFVYLATALIITFRTTMVVGQNVWAIEQKEHANKRVGKYILDTILVKSVGGCTHRCMLNLKCMSFFFRTENALCVLNSVVFPGTAGWIHEDGWRYYHVFGGKHSGHYLM